MKKYIAVLLTCVMGLSMLTGCHMHANNQHQHKHKPHHKQKMHKAPRHGKHYGSEQGQVSNIEMFIVKADSSGGSALPAAAGGGVVGQQIDSSGLDLATDVDVIDGADIGNELAQANKNDREIYRITVNVDNGDTLQIEYEEIEDLRIGDRVKIENGHIDLI
ncbi:MAG: hypothetical protein V4660_03675 [Pseudomonadota bacterium]